MGWIDIKKAYDSIDHGCLKEMMLLHRFPDWVCSTVRNLSRSWNTRIVVTTKKGREASETIMFRKGLPQGDALFPRLFTVCLNPIAWKISASDGYRLSKPIDTKVTDLLYIDDLKIFATSESKLACLMKSVMAAMENVGLQWNPKKCAVTHMRREVLVAHREEVKIVSTTNDDLRCRMCTKELESVPHVLAGCSALAQTKYMSVLGAPSAAVDTNFVPVGTTDVT